MTGGNLNDAVPTMALRLCPGTGNGAALQAQAAARYLSQPLGALLRMRSDELVAALPPGSDTVVLALGRHQRSYEVHARRLFQRIVRVGAHALTPHDPEYPRSLRALLRQNRPAFLTVQGAAGLLDKPAAAIVGARDASSRGTRLAEACARTLAEAGVCVVSGGARGVDLAAHEAALASGGTTVVVLPQGLLTYRAPKKIREGQLTGRAVLVSQFLPDAPWETHAAVTRNATISALARLVCVIEPKKTGGSIRTARHAIAQGTRLLVFCPDETSVATALIRAGGIDVCAPGGTFSAARLLDLWESAPAPRAGQGELFDGPDGV